MFRLTPETLKKLSRCCEIKRGYYSLLILGFLFLLFVVGELLINNRALIVSYEGELYFPTYGEFHPGTDFGQSYTYETNYRDLTDAFAEAGEGNWVLLPGASFFRVSALPWHRYHQPGYSGAPFLWDTYRHVLCHCLHCCGVRRGYRDRRCHGLSGWYL